MIHQLRQNPGDNDHTCINFVLNCYAEVSNPITRPNYFKANYKKNQRKAQQNNLVIKIARKFHNGIPRVCRNTGFIDGGV